MKHFRESIRNAILRRTSYNHFHSGIVDVLKSRYRTGLVYAYGRRAYRSRSMKVSRLRQLRGAVSGPILVLGAGRSVSVLDGDWIRYFRERGGRLMLSNGAAALPPEWISQEDYLVLADPAYFGDVSDGGLASEDVSRDRLLLSQFPGRVFMPAAKERPGTLSSEQVIHFNFEGLEGFGSGIDPTRPRRYSGVTVLAAISVALYLGHAPVLLCGVDHDYLRFMHLDGLNRVHVMGAHFYEEPGKQWDAPGKDMADILYDTARILRDMRLFLGQPVVNLGGETSFVDLFPRACPWYPPTCASEG